ncbi:MAG: LPS export ABC transporter permease LptG [Nitrospina sp.]|nr:LPS export ABC transporter permease LptG [Nitrospina sp.]
MMSLLHRYVLRRFIYCYLLSAAGLIGIFLVVDFFERVDEFIRRDMPYSDLISYFICKIPSITSYMAPQAVLLATVITLAVLARDNEIIAMKAGGIGVTGITLPILGASFVIAFLILASNEYLAPIATKKMNYIFKVKVQGNPVYGDTYIEMGDQRAVGEDKWFVAKNKAVWNIRQFDPKEKIIYDARIFYRFNNGLIRKRIDAKEVVWSGENWEFVDGFLRIFDQEGYGSTEYFEKKIFPVLETPDDIIKKIIIHSDEMSLQELYKEIQGMTLEGKDTLKHRVEFHQKISYPFISIVLALLAIPLSLRSSRHGGVLFCVGINLAMGFVFSFLYAMGVSLGYGGFFSPLFAAWGPFLLFSSLGFYLLFTLDSEYIIPRLEL